MRPLITRRTPFLALPAALALSLVATKACALPQDAPSAPAGKVTRAVVRVDGGEVRGVTKEGVLAFRGIPFAAPPVAALRWRAPQPVVPWEGVRAATTFGPDPAQRNAPTTSGTSEDCLHLNVWRPESAAAAPLPVMVWIYGGGLVGGGASILSGHRLAQQGIVVVTFNYRVGRLGFFAHPALASEAPEELRGNYGYMDQLAALQWVQRNVAAFGGDPGRVTIAGESAGGGSVLVHLASPLSRGLFHRAIVQSAGLPSARASRLGMRPLAEAEAIAVEYARGLGITSVGAEALAALRALPESTLVDGLEGFAAAISGGPEVPGLSHSIIDGKLVVEPPEEALRAGRQARVPVITGVTDADLAPSRASTKEALFALFGPLAARARELHDPKGDASLADLVQRVVADQVFVEPSRHLAERVTEAGERAWFFRFSYVAESLRGKVPGALHAAEIPYAFDVLPTSLRDAATARDLEMARTMSGYWVAFVKTGDPNGDGRPRWPAYEADSRTVQDFTNTGVANGPDPLKARLDLWRDVREGGR